jgi:DNA-binding NtrC family response regulator
VSNTTILDHGATIVRQSGRGRFLVVEGPDRGESVGVGERPLTLGSGADNDLVLTDPTVSRRHLAARLDTDGVLVKDLGSKNGSFVQGARFKELVVGFGAEIFIGQTVLKFLPEEEAVDLPPADTERFGKLLGRDANIRKVFRLLGDVSPTDATILIEGETGTGKELLAEEIHAHSPRKNGPFVVFDCGAVPRELIESALFGHLRGAFTGAVTERKGAFAEADGGTLFLDEIGELASEMQPALLRALDKRTVRPLGATTYQRVDVRIVAATNRGLRSEVAAKRFREDLYYRLAVIKVAVPPLRERLSDIPLLVEHFVREFGRAKNLRVTPADLARLVQHRWPGNVRELRNVVERACLLAQRESLNLDGMLGEDSPGPVVASDSPPPVPTEAAELPYKIAKAQVVDAFERDYFRGLLKRHGGNLSAAARAAQLDRKHLRDLLRKHGLREESE